MKEKMFQAFGSGAATILFGLGQFYGSESLGQVAKTQIKRPFDVFQFASDFGLATGWGKIRTEFSTDTLVVKVENCCFCDGIKMDKPVCYELAGITSETLTLIAKEQVTVRETQCIAKGDALCEFEAGITRKLREALRGTD
jgi:predicted hydrocarbon binding protein